MADTGSTPEGEVSVSTEHIGREQRWVPNLSVGTVNVAGRDYVRWVCSCGAESEPFIDQNGECEADFRRHESSAQSSAEHDEVPS